jgi:ornithine cyclodeaminase
MAIQVINGAQVRALLPMDRCIGLMREAMALAIDDRARQPIRSTMPTPDGSGLIGLMPGFVPGPARLGVKVLTVFAGNHGSDLGSHQGMVLLFDAVSGEPRAIVEARQITAVRTAAASAVATDLLARPDARSLAVLGCGDQAAAHLEALPLVRGFERLSVWGRDFAKARAFAQAQSARLGREIDAVEEIEAAARADVVCTCTAASEPIVFGAWLEGGQHLNLVGASVPSATEIDVAAVARSRYFVDFEPSARALAGDFRRARAAGAVGKDHLLGSIGEVMSGAVEGRRGASDITLCKSLGMIAEDLVAAGFVVAEAERLGVGQSVAW